jgi:hypothetical protein
MKSLRILLPISLALIALSAARGQQYPVETEPKISSVANSVRNSSNAFQDLAPGRLSAMAYALVDQNGNVMLNAFSGTVVYPSSVLSLAATGIVTLSGPTTPALITDTGKTNTGYVQIKGKTSGSLKITTADATAQNVTLSLAAQTSGAATVTMPDYAGANQTLFSYPATGATISAATTPSLTLAAGETNTGFVQVNGKTSGALKITTADATAQTVTYSQAAATTGAATITLPDPGGVNATVVTAATTALTPSSTIAWAPTGTQSAFTLTPGQDETINATVTGCVSGKLYPLVVTATSSSRVITFGTNISSTGTLTTGTDNTKGFVMLFIFDGTKLREVSRTAAQTF